MMLDDKQSISDALNLIEEAFKNIQDIALKNSNDTNDTNDTEVINRLIHKHSYGIKLIKHTECIK